MSGGLPHRFYGNVVHGSQHGVFLHQGSMGTHWPPTVNFPPPPMHPVLPVDQSQPDTLGWRCWLFDPKTERLRSPSHQTVWSGAELTVPAWDEGDAVRGVAGIHAHLVPKHWKIAGYQVGYVDPTSEYAVHGIVERWGKYVLGTEGWRAERVVIKELMAPSTEVGLKLEAAYPDVIVHYPDQLEERPCTSAESSELGKGSRSPNLLPSPSQSQLLPPSGFLNPAVRVNPPPGSSPIPSLSPQTIQTQSNQPLLESRNLSRRIELWSMAMVAWSGLMAVWAVLMFIRVLR